MDLGNDPQISVCLNARAVCTEREAAVRAELLTAGRAAGREDGGAARAAVAVHHR
jgi:hypothetical protein